MVLRPGKQFDFKQMLPIRIYIARLAVDLGDREMIIYLKESPRRGWDPLGPEVPFWGHAGPRRTDKCVSWEAGLSCWGHKGLIAPLSHCSARVRAGTSSSSCYPARWHQRAGWKS